MTRYTAVRRNSLEDINRDTWVPSDPSEAEKIPHINRLLQVRNKILVLGGKGGTGKSTCLAHLASALAASGSKVGILDADISSPSIPRILGVTAEAIMHSKEGWLPVKASDNLSVMSVELLIPADKRDECILWHDSRKIDLINQFISNIKWGQLDYLFIDTPPASSDLLNSILLQVDFTTPGSGALVVTTPQETALVRARKDIDFVKKSSISLLGVIENMVTGDLGDVFPASNGGASALKEKHATATVVARIPFDSKVSAAGDKGVPLGDSPTQKEFVALAKALSS